MNLNTGTPGETVLKCEDVSKSFLGVKALSDVSFSVRHGEIHGLVGANGAGKSTLIKIISGVLKPDSGKIYFLGKELHFENKKFKGIEVVPQEINLAYSMSIGENVMLGSEIKRGLFLDKDKTFETAEIFLSRVGLRVNPGASVNLLSPAQQSLLQIARAICREAVVFIFDEPTGYLTNVEFEHLAPILERLRNEGKGIIYISHKVEEVLKLADRITVLRDGKIVKCFEKEDFSENRIVNSMIGERETSNERTLTSFAKSDVSRGLNKSCSSIKTDSGNAILASNISGQRFREVSFYVNSNEIVGFFGLVGAGRTDIVKAIYGLQPIKSGSLEVMGKAINLSKYNSLEAKRVGIGFAPEERKKEAIFPSLAIWENLLIPVFENFAKNGYLKIPRLIEKASAEVRNLDIKCYSVFQKIAHLSGGNQQKVVLGRWLIADTKVLILDEPTRGVDIGAKMDLYRLIKRTAFNGVAILVVSSEAEELLDLCDRIYIVREGKIFSEVKKGEEWNRETLLRIAMGYKNSVIDN